nr:hypothetical protein ISGA_13445 [Gordonia sp. NB41Y]
MGLDTHVLLRIHGAARAGLVPVLTGNGAASALAVYAMVACGGRLATLPVAHDFLHPVDLLGVRSSNPAMTRLHSGILLGANAAVSKSGPGMLVLESVNQAPTESYLLPWLEE